MKRYGIVLLTILAALSFGGCDLEVDEPEYYYYDFFDVPKTELITPPSSSSFDSIKGYRNALKVKSVGENHYGNDMTEDEIYTFLTVNGSMNKNDANEAIVFLNSNGNNILWADYGDPSKSHLKAILYFEKL